MLPPLPLMYKVSWQSAKALAHSVLMDPTSYTERHLQDTAWGAVRRAYEPCPQRICAAAEKHLCLDTSRSSTVTEVWVSLATPPRNGSHWKETCLGGFFILDVDVPVTTRYYSLQFQWQLWEELVISEHWKLAEEFPKAQCLWLKAHSTFGSFPGRCWHLLAYLLPSLLLKVQLWKPSWEQNFFKKWVSPQCSLISDDESLASKYYSHKDFTDFYFMLNVYPLLANGKLNRAPCSGISVWRWNLRMPFELIVSEFCLHVNATHFGRSGLLIPAD